MKYIKTILLLLAFISLLALSSCSPEDAEYVTLKTILTVDSSFSGSRVIQCTFPKSIVEKGSSAETVLDKIVQKYCPSSMNYTKNTVEEQLVYSFELEFTSSTNYTEKVTEIIGSTASLSFSNPSTVLTTGWKLEESFDSIQLMQWLYDGIASESADLSFELSESSAEASLNGDAQASSTSAISINTLTGYPIQKISVDTLNKGSVYDRTFVFVISLTTFDELGDTLTDYFDEITDSAASSAEWILENNAYNYTVKFTDVTAKELEGYTNKLLNTVYSDISYEDSSTGSTPLAEQNKFTETLDFSSYLGNSNSNVTVEYTYSISDSADLGECMFYINGSWVAASDYIDTDSFLDTNKYGSVVAFRSTDSTLTLEITDGTQYQASSIDFTVIPVENGVISKTITFRYDLTDGGAEACAYAASYFQNINIGAVQTVENGEALCSITFSGSSDEINTKIPDILSSGNTLTQNQLSTLISLRSVTQYTDYIDLSQLLVGVNESTPVHYYIVQDGVVIKSFKSTSSDSGEETVSTLEPDGDTNVISLTLTGTRNYVSYEISTLDLSSAVAVCIISFILFALTSAAIIYLAGKSRTVSLPEQKELLNTEKINEHKKEV